MGNEPLDLRLTLMDRRQCFRWRRRRGVSAACWTASRCGSGATGRRAQAEGAPTGALRHYLDLDRDYAAIAREYDHIPAARRAIELYPGLRVLNQPAWEALICFILSANNNVGRIRSLIAALCKRYGASRPDGAGCTASRRPEALATPTRPSCAAGGGLPRAIPDRHGPAGGARISHWRRCGTCPTTRPTAADHAARRGGQGGRLRAAVRLRPRLGLPGGRVGGAAAAGLVRPEGMSRPAMARQARAWLGEHAGLMQQFLFHAARTGAMALGERDP